MFGILNWAFGWVLFVPIGIGTLGLGFLLAFITHWVVNSLLLYGTDALIKTSSWNRSAGRWSRHF